MPWTASRLLKAVLGEATAEAWRDPSGAIALLHVALDAWRERRLTRRREAEAHEVFANGQRTIQREPGPAEFPFGGAGLIEDEPLGRGCQLG